MVLRNFPEGGEGAGVGKDYGKHGYHMHMEVHESYRDDHSENFERVVGREREESGRTKFNLNERPEVGIKILVSPLTFSSLTITATSRNFDCDSEIEQSRQ